MNPTDGTRPLDMVVIFTQLDGFDYTAQGINVVRRFYNFYNLSFRVRDEKESIMTRFKRLSLWSAALGVAILLLLLAFFYRPTRLALERAEAFSFRRMTVARLANGEANWLGFILDGAGEAKIDLLPGSRFLIELNSREHPEDVDMSIIAGITSPWDESDINRWLNSLRQRIPDNHQSDINAFGTYLTSMTHDLGDGLVTVESTRLEGIPHQTVSGTHLSMIRNITQNSQRMPPAVPLIVGWLKK